MKYFAYLRFSVFQFVFHSDNWVKFRTIFELRGIIEYHFLSNFYVDLSMAIEIFH